MPELSNKRHELFCQEYLKDLNGKQAYERVYGVKKNVKTSEANSSRLLGNDKVQQRIDELKMERVERVQVKADDVLLELLRIASLDPGKLFDNEGKALEIHELDENTRRTISSFEFDVSKEKNKEGEAEYIRFIKRIKFWDKNKALESLGRHLRLFTDKLELGGDKDNPIQVKRVDLEDRISQIKGKE